jgi:hypothetical protein
MNDIFEDTCVLVTSCDKVSWIWQLWYNTFTKYWDWSIPWPIYFQSEHINPEFNDDRVTSLVMEKDVPWGQWGDGVITACDMIKENYILLMMEDEILNETVSREYFEIYCEMIDKYDIDVLCATKGTLQQASKGIKHAWQVDIEGQPKPLFECMKDNYVSAKYKGLDFYRKHMNSAHIINLSPCIWEKEALKKCMIKNQSPRTLEQKGCSLLKSNDVKIRHYFTYVGKKWWSEGLKGGGKPRSSGMYENCLNNMPESRRKTVKDLEWIGEEDIILTLEFIDKLKKNSFKDRLMKEFTKELNKQNKLKKYINVLEAKNNRRII